MARRLRVLELFDAYLNTSENWAFHIIDNVPDADVVIATKHFLRCNFYRERFEYIEFPLRWVNSFNKKIGLRVTNKIVSELLRLYPWYVEKTCGKCDVMHSHFAPVAWSYLKLAKRLGIPHIVSFYGYDYESLPFRKPIWRQRYVQLFKDVDLILCEGSHGASILERNGCPSEKIRIMQLGVKADHIPFWKRIKMSGELHLLQVAAFTEKKGHQYTIDAFLETKRDCPNMTLTLVGNNKQFIKSSLQKYVNKSQFGDKIQFLDAIDFCHLHEFMKNYHVFIHPSCYGENRDCEGGAPIVFLDAQATGMPVIATTHCDIPDEVIHEKTGLLSPEKDTQSLAASIRRFYFMSQVEYDGFSRKARRHVEENYDVTKKGQELRNLYEGILKKKPGF